MLRYRFAIPVLLGAASMLMFGSLSDASAVTVRKLENSVTSSSDPVFNDSLSITKKTGKKSKFANKKNKKNKVTKVWKKKKKQEPIDLGGVPPVTGPGTGQVIGEVINNPPKLDLPQGPVGGTGGVSYEVVPATTPIPVPGALPLLATGLAGFGYLAHRRKKAAKA